eukprot:Pompholyxophrys_punicea_v1_NODE_302_length_2323_cov_4.263228.p2 type:complete len:207 gc:universal NODE_302_length_2323_cov_4.263228:676-56(-)
MKNSKICIQTKASLPNFTTTSIYRQPSEIMVLYLIFGVFGLKLSIENLRELISNWKNIPYTLATRAELEICNLGQKIFYSQYVAKESSTVLRSVPHEIDLFGLTIFGTEFRVNTTVRLDGKTDQSNGWPVYYLILRLFSDFGQFKLVLQPYQIICFDYRFLAFRVEESPELIEVVNASQIYSNFVTTIWTVDKFSYISDRCFHPCF